MDDVTKCPFSGGARAHRNRDWWPDALDIEVLHHNSALSDPMGKDFDYAKEFKSLDLNAVIKDLQALMTNSQEWWPADFGHYGGLMIRMAWHSPALIASPTAAAAPAPVSSALRRSTPGRTTPTSTRRGGCCGRSSRNTAANSPGPTSWSLPATSRWSRWASRRSVSPAAAPTSGSRKSSTGGRKAPGSATNATAANVSSPKPLGAVQMGLIYVNPEGPNGNPDPVAAAKDIRETFFRMAMNDEETVALIAGGHTFGKTHGAGDPSLVGAGAGERRARGPGPRLEEQARHRHRRRRHHRRSGSHLDADADQVEQSVLQESVRKRMGADQEPGRRQAVAGERARKPPSRTRSTSRRSTCRPC